MEKTLKNAELIESLLACDLSPYAKQFVLSLKSWSMTKGITVSQRAALRRIELNYNSAAREKEKKREPSWIAVWDEDKIKKARICAQYYIENPPYFNDLAFRILNYEDYVPTREEYDKLVNNKYARRILKEYFSPARFKEGALVTIRKPALSRLSLLELANVPLLILRVSAAAPVHAATGAKRYMALPMGRDKPILIEERYIKKYNKNY